MIRIATLVSCALIACTSPTNPNPDPGGIDAGNTADVAPAGDLELPFAVDDWFAPSGYMGDGATAGAIADDEECGARGGQARGMCHRFTWHPSGTGWAGVYWQYPDGNWGTLPGLAVPGGASQVSFYAWAQVAGGEVSFMVGMADVDGFEVKAEAIALTAEPVRHTLSLADSGYSVVVGGFGWVAADRDSELVFFVDDIAWE